MGSKAALAQDNCDPDRKRTNYATVGGGPFCVNPWKAGKSNGGATAPGVTATTVKVLVLTPNSEQEAAQRSRGGSLPVNQVTGERGTWEDAFRDFNTVAVEERRLPDVGSHGGARVPAVVGERRGRTARRRDRGRRPRSRSS